jgi:predicted HTH transcriptional regulator
MEETRHFEFKTIAGRNPVKTIKNTIAEYAVAFLNSEGGRIYWGIKDDDRSVVGIRLDHSERDELRRSVADKLSTINPPIDPTHWRVEISPVFPPDGYSPLQDLVVVEIIVPRPDSASPYATSGNEVFVRVDGCNRKLTGLDLIDWFKRRSGRDDG